MLNVSNADVDPPRHDGYLEVIGSYSEPLSRNMQLMGVTAGTAARSLTPFDCAAAAAAMFRVRDSAAAFLDHLAPAHTPDYLRGADGQLQDALKLLIDAGRRGAEGAIARDREQIEVAAAEMNVANRDIALAAQRISDWRRGAARP